MSSNNSQSLKDRGRKNQGELIVFILVAASYFFALTYKAFGYYFDMHDIHNLSWGHIRSPLYFLVDTFNPVTNATIHTYRPAGALFYNVCYQFFTLNFAGYHFATSALHLLNTTIVFILIRDFTKHTLAAFLGGIIFAFHVTAIPAYWKFSSSFDVLCGTLVFLSFFFYLKSTSMRSVHFFLSLLFFFFACRTKEMAFALPFILLMWEILMPSFRTSSPQSRASLLPFFAIAVLLGLPKLIAGIFTEKGHAYALDLNSLAKNILFYWNSVLGTSSDSHLGWIHALLSGLIALLTRNKLLQFGYAYIYAALAPVLLLATHRQDFFMYVPLFGICLYVAELYRTIEMVSIRKRANKIYIYSLLIVFIAAYTIHNIQIKQTLESTYLKEALQVKNMIRLMQPLQPRKNSMIFFDSTPDFFDEVVLTSAAHLLYHDWTIHTKIIEDCEKVSHESKRPEVYCVAYQKQKIHRIKL